MRFTIMLFETIFQVSILVIKDIQYLFPKVIEFINHG